MRFLGREGTGLGTSFNQAIPVSFPSYGANLANDGTDTSATLPNAGDPDTVGVHVKIKNNGNAPLGGVTFAVEDIPAGSTVLNTGCTTAMVGYTCALNLAVTPALVTFNPPLTTLGHSGSGTEAAEYVLRYQLPSGYTQQQHTIAHKIAGTENKVGGTPNALSLNTVVQQPAPPPPPQATVNYGVPSPLSGSTFSSLPGDVQLAVTINNSATGAVNIAANAATYEISGLPANLPPGNFTCTGSSVCGSFSANGATGIKMLLSAIPAGQNPSFTVKYTLPGATADGSYNTTHSVTGAGVAANGQGHNFTIAIAQAAADATVGYSNLSPASGSTIGSLPADVQLDVTINNSASGAAAIATGAATYSISGLPAGLNMGNFTCTGTVCGTITVTGTGMSMPLDAIAAGQNASFTVKYTLPTGTAGGSYTATHSVTGAGVAANGQQHNFTIPSAIPPATVGYSNLSPAAGSTIGSLPADVQLDVAVNNSASGAAAIAAGAATYSISGLPAGLNMGNFTCTGSVCGTITVTGTGMSMPLVAIAAGQNASFTVKYTLPTGTAGGSYTTTHSVTGAGVAANGQQHNYTIAAAGLASASYSQTATVAVPGTVSSTVTVNNSAGAAIAADAASYTIGPLPAGASNAKCVLQGSTTPCSSTQAGISGNTLTALLPAIAAGGTASFVVTYDLPATTPTATYSLPHNVSGAGIAASQQQSMPLVVVLASSLPAAGQASIAAAEISGFIEATVVINNLGQSTAITGAIYEVEGLPPGITAIACAPAALCGAAGYDATNNIHSVALNPIAAGTLASITFRYPVGATTPDHTGTHRIRGGGMDPQSSVLPFAWRSGSGGAVSVPAVAPLGLLLLSLLAAGVPAAVARRRRG